MLERSDRRSIDGRILASDPCRGRAQIPPTEPRREARSASQTTRAGRPGCRGRRLLDSSCLVVPQNVVRREMLASMIARVDPIEFLGAPRRRPGGWRNSHNFSHTPRTTQKRHATPGNRFPRTFRGFLNDSDRSVYVGDLLHETRPPPSAPVSSLQERLLAQQSSSPLAAFLECAQHPAGEHELITQRSSAY
jgi:hypothetical protein